MGPSFVGDDVLQESSARPGAVDGCSDAVLPALDSVVSVAGVDVVLVGLILVDRRPRENALLNVDGADLRFVDDVAVYEKA